MRNASAKTNQQKNAVQVIALHRRGHGSTAWSAEASLLQPQDGAEKTTLDTQVVDISNRRNFLHVGKAFSEPEDARLTGGTRSLMRRMFGLNIAARAVAKITPTRSLTAKTPLTA